jgi:hypothetical protein
MRLLERGGNHLPQTAVKVASPHPDARIREWLPSLSAMIWITLFLGLCLSGARIVLISADSDPALHRRLGEWMLQHRAIMHEDGALHTYQGPFVSMEWLSDVLFAVAGRVGGWNGIVLIAATVIATCFWLLHRQLLADGCDAVLTTLLVLVAIFTCSMHWLARPLVFTHLLILVFAWQLRGFRQGRVSARQLFLLLPPLMVLWVNLHGGFVLGLMLLAMYAVGATFNAWRQAASWNTSRVLTILLLACGAASLVNPNSWKLHLHIVNFLRSPELSSVTTEFASPNFHTVGMHGFLLLLFLMATALLIIRPQLDATDVLLMGGWGYFALLSARNVPIFALIVTPLLAQWINGYLRANELARWCRRYREWATCVILKTGTASIALVIAAVVCMTLVVAKPSLAGGEPVLATDYPPDHYPTDVVDYLRVHPDRIHGEMFNLFIWSGYLEFASPEHKPFVDSRNDFYGVDLTREFRKANEPKPGWEDVFTKYRVGWTMLPAQHPLNQILKLRPDWQLVFSNRQALVYSRQP